MPAGTVQTATLLVSAMGGAATQAHLRLTLQ
jgi:hypothetical protein